MTSALGTAGTSVFVTGISGTTLSLGDETQETSYEAPSVSVTSSTGTVSIRYSDSKLYNHWRFCYKYNWNFTRDFLVRCR